MLSSMFIIVIDETKEMAENASTVFNVHVPEFVDAIWVALRDPELNVRERAVEALRACLRVIEKRETRWRVQWYVLLGCTILLAVCIFHERTGAKVRKFLAFL